MSQRPPTSSQKFPRSIAAVIVAAGRGERAGAVGGPKQYRSIGGQAIIARSIDQALAEPRVDRIVVAIHADDRALFEAGTGTLPPRVTTVVGGGTRQESVRIALESLADAQPDAVLIHDAVRPFAGPDVWDRVIDGITISRGACAAMPLVDTVKRRGEDGDIASTVQRSDLFGAQTPQGFPFEAILGAHRRAASEGKKDFTDDASLAEWVGLPVRLVEGSLDNTKITWARDIDVANRRLGGASAFPDVRTGNGYDVHALEPGDFVTLCGVAIPHNRRLKGHSDADVGLHALTDALLATCGAGDIGTHFPPSDPQWRGAASRIFVEHAAKIVRKGGGRIANADISLICEAPRVGPHREAMVAALSTMLGIARDRISVKATTNEKLGFLGREEGIAAIATATVVYPGSLPE